MRSCMPMDADEADEQVVAAAISDLTDVDLARLRALAFLHARTLPDQDWTDLLHEAIVRALDGTREWPPDVPIVAFLAGIMRSIAHDLRRRAAQERAWRSDADAHVEQATCDPGQRVAATRTLAAILSAFEHDPIVLQIIEGLAFGRSAAEIRALHKLSPTVYDSARKRLRRALLRLDV